MEGSAQSRWRLWFDLYFIRTLIWLSATGKDAEPRPEVHIFLAHRYSRLSHAYAERAPAKAEHLQKRAAAHYAAAGIRPLPPAVAGAMPRPRRLSFTHAVGKRRPPPDDAA